MSRLSSRDVRWTKRWRHRSAADIQIVDRVVLIALTAAGGAMVVRLADWWFRRAHVSEPLLFSLLSLAFWYGITRIVIGWVNYLAIRRPEHRAAPKQLTVAIFTTSSPGEPLEMFDRTLAACARVRYPHTTYLLDDTRDPAYRELAERHGAVWLELAGVPGAKAGKINRALERTDEEFILVLDPDHLPFPEFLDRVLGQFSSADVGFVQVAQSYYNQDRSFTAAAAAEQTYAFYGPVLMGLSGHGAALAIGANCTFRRSALTSIGGHGIGLAEDLVTAIRLHARGWRSVYVPEIVSRGLVPEDLTSFYRQQLKWSRGVYEVLFTELPRNWSGLSARQRLLYLTIGTYYLCGCSTALYVLFPYLYLWTGAQPAAMRYAAFLLAIAPVAIIGITVYLFVQRWLCDPEEESGLHWRGLMLKIACWPTFVAGTFLGLARMDVPYVPTAKAPVAGNFLRLAWPHLALLLIYAATFVRVAVQRIFTEDVALDRHPETVWGMTLFATVPVVASLGALYAAWQSRRPARAGAWGEVDIASIGGSE